MFLTFDSLTEGERMTYADMRGVFNFKKKFIELDRINHSDKKNLCALHAYLGKW